jgi:restriction system protein
MSLPEDSLNIEGENKAPDYVFRTIIKLQVKSNDGSIGDSAVSALYGKIGAGEFGLFLTLGTFTKQAINFAVSKSNLRLIDGDELVDLVL